MNELERERQKFEKQMAADHKDVLLKLDRRNRTFSVIIGILAAVEVFAAFAQMAFPLGWPWLQRIVGSLPSPPPSMPGF